MQYGSFRQPKCLSCISLVLVFALTLSSSAQRQPSQTNDPESIASFVNSIAKDVYSLAWPTATYRSVALNGIDPVPGGFDVTVKLSGISAFDNGDLWVRLLFQFRNGTLADMKVRDNNAILAAPFSTVKVLGNLTAQIAQQYAQSQSASSAPAAPAAPPTPSVAPVASPATAQLPQPVAATCITNDTDAEIKFQYQSEDGTSWTKSSLPAHRQLSVWGPSPNPASDAPTLKIEYDDDYAPGYTPRRYVLRRTESSMPVNCTAVPQYSFVTEGSKIVVYSIGPSPQ